MRFSKAGWIGLASALVLTCAGAASGAAAEELGQGTPFADGTVAAGAIKAQVCAACHGPNGNSINPQFPKLAGQDATYLVEQLHLFKTGVRTNAIMRGIALTLTDQDMDNVGVFYQAQTPVGGEAAAALYQAGENLYRFGDPARSIPACTACHGPVGRGNELADYPALRAQYAVYIVSQLTAIAGGTRYGPAQPGAPSSRNGYMMATIAKRLSSDDMNAVAAYIQGMR